MAENKGQSTREENQPDADMCEAEIDYNVMGSFPASDPPSWTLGISPHKKERSKFDEDLPSTDDPSHQNEPVEPTKSGHRTATASTDS